MTIFTSQMMKMRIKTKSLSTSVSFVLKFLTIFNIFLVFTFKTFKEASDFIGEYFSQKENNVTSFADDWPALLSKSLNII